MSSNNGSGQRETLFRCMLCPADTQLFTMAEREVHTPAHNGFSHFEFASPPLPTSSSTPVAAPPAPAPPQRLSNGLNGTQIIQPRTQTSNFNLPIPGQSGVISIAISITVHPDGNIGVTASPSVSESSHGNPRIVRNRTTAGLSARPGPIVNRLLRRARRDVYRHRAQETRAPSQSNHTPGNHGCAQSPRETRSICYRLFPVVRK